MCKLPKQKVGAEDKSGNTCMKAMWQNTLDRNEVIRDLSCDLHAQLILGKKTEQPYEKLYERAQVWLKY